MGASSSHQGVKEPVSQVSMISYKTNTEQENAKSEERNGHTNRNEHKNGLSNGHHNQNGTHTNEIVQNSNHVKEGRREKQEDEIDAKERKFRKQAEFGIACFRPRRLQCLAKSLWTFIGFYSFCSMWLVTVMGYLRTQIMTLERYLHINSSQWGVLMTWNDVGSLIFVIVGSHFGKFGHVPRLLAASSLIVGVLMMSLSLIQAISPVYLPKAGNSNISWFSLWGNYLCDNSTISNNLEMHNMTSLLNGMALPKVEQGMHWGYYMMSVIMFVVGAVMSYDIPLVTYFVERNVQDSARSGVFVGALLAAFVLGSPISMFLGGAMSGIPVDLEDTQMTIYDPRWMGAWWLGFLIVGGGAALFSLPVCLIPRHIIHDEDDEDDNDKSEEQEKGKGTGKLKSLFYGRSQQTTETKKRVSRQTEHKEVSQANWMDQLKGDVLGLMSGYGNA